VIQGEESSNWSADEMGKVTVQLDPLDRMTLADSLSYLSDDILQKVDRAAMAVSLETRSPSWTGCRGVRSTNSSWHEGSRGPGQMAVRQVLYKHVPRP